MITIYAAIFLIGGAVAKPGTSGSMSEQGMVEVLYVGEFLGLILMWWGFELCTRAPKPMVDEPVVSVDSDAGGAES